MELHENLKDGVEVSTDLKSIYTQECDEHHSEIQELSIEIANGGGGDYFVLKTDRWAFENIEDVEILLKMFKEKYDLLLNNIKKSE